MGSTRRKIHNDCVKMTEDKMKTTLQSKKSREEETMTLNKAAAPLNALRNASSYLKHKQAAAVQWVESFVMVDE